MKAYDGHMNLILSDVEETIMIVEQVEGSTGTQPVINVSILQIAALNALMRHVQVAKRKMDMLFVRGDGVILVGTVCLQLI